MTINAEGTPAPAVPAAGQQINTPATEQPTSGAPAGGSDGPKSFRDMPDLDEKDMSVLDQVVKESTKGKEKPGKTDDDDDDLDADDESDDDGADLDDDESDDDETDEDKKTDGDEDDDEDSDDETDDDEADDGENKVFLKQKVNGKMMEYTEEQVRTMVASGAHTMQRAQEVDRKAAEIRATLAEELKTYEQKEQKYKPIEEALEKGDIESAFVEMTAAKGLSKLEVKRKLRDVYLPVIADRLGLPRDWVRERLNNPAVKQINKEMDLEEENLFLKTSKEVKKEVVDPKTEQAGKAKENLINFQRQHGVSDAEMKQSIEWLLENKLGGDEKKLTLEAVSTAIQRGRLVDRALDAITAVRPKLINEPKFVNRVVAKLGENPKWTVGQAGRWVAKQAKKRLAKENVSAEKKALTDLGRKVATSGTKSRLEKPNAQQKRAVMRFQDLPEDGEDGRELD